MYIIGAGMAGCIAAILNPTATIIEGSSTRPDNHKAVLRFRTKAISDLAGIEFETIKVHKSIWYKGQHHNECNPMFANMYSQKVVGKISDRSIWNLETVERYVAPEDFHSRLLERLENENRIHYGEKVHEITPDKILTGLDVYDRDGCAVISTMPMPLMPLVTNIQMEKEQTFKSKEIIAIQGHTIVDSNVHQTIYYPDFAFPVYRATLTGRKLIVELVENAPSENIQSVLDEVAKSFGLYEGDYAFNFDANRQKFGKIASIDQKTRKQYMFDLTDQMGIYSLGRFATWKNILLDDVLDDLYFIQKLIQSDNYDKKKLRN